MAFLLYSGFLVYRTRYFYNRIVQCKRAMKGHLHVYDHELGYVGVPEAEGSMVFPLGPELPVRYDARGFRVPVGADTALKRPLVLSLGCSFTYGDGLPAEETYAYRTAEMLGGYNLNAAMCAYGLGQMLAQARDLIPRYHPDVVLVQFSTWLVDRSLMVFMPTYAGFMPSPYFAEEANGQVVLRPALFTSKLFDLPVYSYQCIEQPNALTFVSFVLRVGLPLYIHDDVITVRYAAMKVLPGYRERLPSADSTSFVQTVRHAYGEIHQLCLAHGGRMVLVRINTNRTVVPGQADLLQLPGVVYADADSALFTPLKDKSAEGFSAAYRIWRGDPPRMVDYHPNAAAHAIIAQTIVAALKASEAAPLAVTN